MTDKKKKYEKPFHLDMNFEEALDRFSQVDPGEMIEELEKKRSATKKRIKNAREEIERGARPRRRKFRT